MYLPERLLLDTHREYLVDGLSGAVLDVGAGTGAMFPYFARQMGNVETDATGEGEIRTIDAIEPDPHMRRQAEKRAANLDASIRLADGRAESMPYADDAFDAVVASFVFCTIDDPHAAIDEIARVLKPGGEFRFVEHVRGEGTVGSVHDTLAPAWHCVAGGCHLNRETGRLFQEHGAFTVLEYNRFDSGLTRALPIIRGVVRLRPKSLLSRVKR